MTLKEFIDGILKLDCEIYQSELRKVDIITIRIDGVLVKYTRYKRKRGDAASLKIGNLFLFFKRDLEDILDKSLYNIISDRECHVNFKKMLTETCDSAIYAIKIMQTPLYKLLYK